MIHVEDHAAHCRMAREVIIIYQVLAGICLFIILYIVTYLDLSSATTTAVTMLYYIINSSVYIPGIYTWNDRMQQQQWPKWKVLASAQVVSVYLSPCLCTLFLALSFVPHLTEHFHHF